MSERAENPDRRQELRADCGRCAGLCCVAPVFAASTDFAINKPAGQPCPNLGADFGCGIHDNLRERGFPGCAVFDCFGAGQQVVQVTFGGRHWRENPASTTSMFTVFTVMRQLHELLWYLAEALTLQPTGQLHHELKRAQRECERLTGAGPDELVLFDATAHRREVGPLLERVSQAVRAEVRDRGPDRSGVDLIGAKLQGADLRGVSLHGAYLLGADLRGANLYKADLLGADLRAADLRTAKLDGSIFLTQPQLDAGAGDAATTIPSSLTRPRHWSTSITHVTARSRRRRR